MTGRQDSPRMRYGRRLPAICASTLSLVTMLAPAAHAAPVTVVPTLQFEEALTDNANVSASGKDFDSISTLGLGFDVAVATRRTTFAMKGVVEYEKYIATSDLDSFGVNLIGAGRESLIHRFLSLDTEFSVSNEFTNRSLIPATSRLSAPGYARVITYDAGPTLTTKIGDHADVLLRGRYGGIQFENNSASAVPLSLNNARILQGTGLITSGNRIRRIETTLSGEYLKQNQGFLLYQGLYSLFVQIIDDIRVVGRAGYERITDPGITDTRGVIWSGGLIAKPGRQSSIRVEYGRRYNRPTWDVAIAYELTPKIALTGLYTKTLETEQTRLRRTLSEIKEPSADFPIGTPVLPDIIQPDLINGTFLSEDLNFALVYAIDPPYRWSPERKDNPDPHVGTQLAITGGLSDRKIFDTNTEERLLSTNATLTQEISRSLNLVVSADYQKTLEPRAPGLQNTLYRMQFGLTYRFNRTATASLTYTRQDNFTGNDGTIRENVLAFSLGKRL